MNLARNRKKFDTSMQLHGIGSITVFCLILSACATPSAKNGPVVTAESKMPSTSETKDKSDVVDRCGIANNDSPEENVMVVQASGGAEDRCPAGTKISSRSSICLKESEKVTILTKEGTRLLSGPGCFDVESGLDGQATSSNSISTGRFLRTGSIRAAGVEPGSVGAMSAPPTVDLGEVKVISGSKSAVQRYKLKATILTGTKICLKQSESLTVLRKKGGVLNLKGPGCNVFRSSGEIVNIAGVSGGQ